MNILVELSEFIVGNNDIKIIQQSFNFPAKFSVSNRNDWLYTERMSKDAPQWNTSQTEESERTGKRPCTNQMPDKPGPPNLQLTLQLSHSNCQHPFDHFLNPSGADMPNLEPPLKIPHQLIRVPMYSFSATTYEYNHLHTYTGYYSTYSKSTIIGFLAQIFCQTKYGIG